MTQHDTQRVETYTAADGTPLPLHVFTPVGAAKAAILLFHGGCWMAGSPAKFFPTPRHWRRPASSPPAPATGSSAREPTPRSTA